jgi:guanyl-specific ribonuclease Sa
MNGYAREYTHNPPGSSFGDSRRVVHDVDPADYYFTTIQRGRQAARLVHIWNQVRQGNFLR